MAEEGVEGKLAAVDVTTNRPLGDEFGVKVHQHLNWGLFGVSD